MFDVDQQSSRLVNNLTFGYLAPFLFADFGHLVEQSHEVHIAVDEAPNAEREKLPISELLGDLFSNNVVILRLVRTFLNLRILE